ncbi:MAG: ATP/GTP-binding protein [Erysipelotrichaceae bacterium]
MLIRFNVRNFLSFSSREDGGTEEFSMIAGKVRGKKEHLFDDGKLKLLKFAAVYGANAAGKSNLVKAMDFMRQVILFNLPDGHTEKYCKVEPENINVPSYFEMEILLKGKYYSYGFEVILSQSKFVSEWLVELRSDNSEKLLFTRDIENGVYEFGGELARKGLKDKLDVYADDIRQDSTVLFLSIMNQNKKNLYESFREAEILKDTFLWFKNSLDINYPDQPISDYSYLMKADKVNEVCRMISAFGTGITDFKLVNVPIEKVLRGMPRTAQERVMAMIEREHIELRNNTDIKNTDMVLRSRSDFFIITIDESDNVKCQTIEFSHGKKNVLFNLEEESDGTVRILDMLEILLSGDGKTYVLDELDRCLHPSLSYKFVETFLHMAEKKNIQLIVTTHESRLMDFDLLRRDEIWFIDKKDTGNSDIYSLEEYNARFDQKIDKAYLEGRYGGVPVFSTIFPVKEEAD